MNTENKFAAEKRIDDLIARMTPEEKTAQLRGIWLRDLLDENGRISLTACAKHIPHGGGHICQYSSATSLKPEELVQTVRDLQCFLREKTRLGIPALCQEEAITGLAARGATTLPQQINLSCTWNLELLRDNTQSTARTMRTMRLTLRPGAYTVFIGASATDIRLRAELTLTGDAVALARREHFFSQTSLA